VGTASTTSRAIGFAILSSLFLLSLWTWQAQGRGEIFVPLKSIPAHGTALVLPTALGGGLAVEVIRCAIQLSSVMMARGRVAGLAIAARHRSPPVVGDTLTSYGAPRQRL
jgi:hypothetical protein